MKQEKPLREPTKAEKKLSRAQKKSKTFSTWAIKEFVVEHTHVMGHNFRVMTMNGVSLSTSGVRDTYSSWHVIKLTFNVIWSVQ